MLRGVVYVTDAQYEKAYQDLMKIFSAADDDQESFRGMQSLADKRVDLQFALTYFTRAAYGHSDEQLLQMKKGLCFLVLEDRWGALKEFNAVVKTEPSAVSHFFTALSFEHLGIHDSAFHHYDRALQFDNDIFDAHKKRGIYHTELKNWRAAYKDFGEMERIEPSLKITYRLRGVCRLRFNDYYGTILDMTRYLQRDTTDYEIYSTRAFALTNVRDFPGANKDLKKAIALQPDNYNLNVSLIENYLDLRDTTNALVAIDSCLARNGVRIDIVVAKIRILIGLSRLEEARKLIVAHMPSKENWLYSAEVASIFLCLDGLSSLEQRDFRLALKKFNTALKTNKSNHEALYHRAKTALMLGERKDALHDLEKLSRLGYADSSELLAGLQSN
jgi:tetratricopeptide (TPR) repeat protein